MTPEPRSWLGPAVAAVATTILVTLLSYGVPPAYAATAVGLAFLGATYFFALAGGAPDAARRYGLSLGGLLDPEPLGARRMLLDTAREGAVALGLAAVILPPFWIGWMLWWEPAGAFQPTALGVGLADEALGQVLVIALPEEAFYRGYLQTRFDAAWRPRRTLLGATLGPGLLASSAVFAIGHLATDLHPSRLAVFFPALLFGWLRARRGGIGAATLLHALCNLFASSLARGYGFAS